LISAGLCVFRWLLVLLQENVVFRLFINRVLVRRDSESWVLLRGKIMLDDFSAGLLTFIFVSYWVGGLDFWYVFIRSIIYMD